MRNEIYESFVFAQSEFHFSYIQIKIIEKGIAT